MAAFLKYRGAFLKSRVQTLVRASITGTVKRVLLAANAADFRCFSDVFRCFRRILVGLAQSAGTICEGPGIAETSFPLPSLLGHGISGTFLVSAMRCRRSVILRSASTVIPATVHNYVATNGISGTLCQSSRCSCSPAPALEVARPGMRNC